MFAVEWRTMGCGPLYWIFHLLNNDVMVPRKISPSHRLNIFSFSFLLCYQLPLLDSTAHHCVDFQFYERLNCICAAGTMCLMMFSAYWIVFNMWLLISVLIQVTKKMFCEANICFDPFPENHCPIQEVDVWQHIPAPWHYLWHLYTTNRTNKGKY